MRLAVLVLDGAFTSGIAAAVDVFRTAELLRPRLGESVGPFTVDVLSPDTDIRTGAGFGIPITRPWAAASDHDVVMVAAPGCMDAESVISGLRSEATRQVVDALTGLPRDRPVVAACSGTFLLAEAGVLDGRRATTSWWLGAAFRARYPQVTLDMDLMVVEDGRVTTAGAAFGHIDLALSLVRRVSLDLADTVARYLLVDQRETQTQYAAITHLARMDTLVAAFERHVRAHLADPLDMPATARALGTSRRTLERRVSTVLGMSPLQTVRRIRADHAEHLLRTTEMTVDDVAHRVGYANAASLRHLLRRSPG